MVVKEKEMDELLATKNKFEVSRSRADVRLQCNHKKGGSEAVVEADWTKLHAAA